MALISRRLSSLRRTAGLGALALGLVACTGGPGSEEDLVNALTRDRTFTRGEATCIAENVFAEYGDDEEALGKISGADDYEDLSGTEGVPGFAEFFENVVAGCTGT